MSDFVPSRKAVRKKVVTLVDPKHLKRVNDEGPGDLLTEEVLQVDSSATGPQLPYNTILLDIREQLRRMSPLHCRLAV